MYACIYHFILSLGYHDTLLNFGIVKSDKEKDKPAYKPASDFGFEILVEVISTNPSSSGFLINLTPDRGGTENASLLSRLFNSQTEYHWCLYTISLCRLCYFTAISTNRKADFMRELNNSYKFACLQCSFTDTQLSEYIQYKRRKTDKIPVKYAVSHVGKQEDDTWVLGGNIYISPDGELIPVEGSEHVWLGSMFRGAGVADGSVHCSINLPLSTKPLKQLLCYLETVMKHNFLPCALTMAGNYN